MEEGYYLYETFEGGHSGWDDNFTRFLNTKYDGGYKYKDCQYHSEGGKRYAYCVFKRK